VSDMKQEGMPIPERVTIIALAEEGGDAARRENAHFPQRRRRRWCIIPPIAGCYGSEGHTAKCTAALLSMLKRHAQLRADIRIETR